MACRQLMGLLLLVYVRSAHLPHCRPTRTAALGTGLLGAGNKGAVAASLRLHSRLGLGLGLGLGPTLGLALA